ncbi:MAG: hypothetical protein ACOYN2_03380 [Patescibacteria group bacterium]
METPLVSLPYGMKSIWQVVYFEKELILLGGIVLLIGIIILYRSWRRAEIEAPVVTTKPSQTNWQARYKTLNPSNDDFAGRVESLLIEYVFEVHHIALQSSLTTEEKTQLLHEPDIVECLRLSRDIRYAAADKVATHIDTLDQIAQRIFK